MDNRKFTKRNLSSYEIARRYFAVLCALNSIEIGDKALSVLAYISTHPDFSRKELKEGFRMSSASLSNIFRRLEAKKFVEKGRPNALILAGWQKGIHLEIFLEHEQL